MSGTPLRPYGPPSVRMYQQPGNALRNRVMRLQTDFSSARVNVYADLELYEFHHLERMTLFALNQLLIEGLD